MLSIITVVNNESIYNTFLKKSLLNQTFHNYEVIKIENKNNEYKTLGDAYRDGISRCKGELIMFAHPDIYFYHETELSTLVDRAIMYFNNDSLIKIIGVAGIDYGSNGKIYSTIVHGNCKQDFSSKNNLAHIKYKEVQTVDACCFIGKKEYFLDNFFSKKLMGFHFFIEELCLRNNKNGFKNIVIPCSLWHYSSGASLDYTYYREAIKIIKKYKYLDYINTTSFKWKCNFF